MVKTETGIEVIQWLTLFPWMIEDVLCVELRSIQFNNINLGWIRGSALGFKRIQNRWLSIFDGRSMVKMDKNSTNGMFYHIYLNVRLLPCMRMVRVPLTKESTALDVVEACKETFKLNADYLLFADFNGFEKQFGPQERLYHLVKKQILWAGLDHEIQFFIKKKKKQTTSLSALNSIVDTKKINVEPVERDILTGQCSPSTSLATCEGRLRLNSNTQSSFNVNTDEDRFTYTDNGNKIEGRKMAEQQKEAFVGQSLASHLNAMSFTDLLQLADQQKRQIDANNGMVHAKEAKLKALRNQQRDGGINTETESALSSRLFQVRQQIKAEDAQLQHLRRLRAEVEDVRRRNVTARIDLQEARRVFAEKERQLKEAAGHVQELIRQLDMERRRRLIMNKESELSHLDSEFNATATGNLGGMKNGNAGAEINGNTGIIIAAPVSIYAQQQRPKAAVEPFKITPPIQSAAVVRNEKMENAPGATQNFGNGDYGQYGPSLDYLHSKGFVAAFSAMEEVLQQTTNGRLTPLNGSNGQNKPSDSASNCASTTPLLDDTNANQFRNVQHQLPQPVIPKVNISINRRFQIANASRLLSEERPPPDLIPASEKTKFSNYDTIASTSGPAGNVPNTKINNESVYPIGEADKINLRNDTLRAVKRRSWAENHAPATIDEAEHIRLLLSRAQQRGKSSLNLSWIFDHSTTPANGQQHIYGHQRTSSLSNSYPEATTSKIDNSLIHEEIISPEPSEPPPPPPISKQPSPPSRNEEEMQFQLEETFGGNDKKSITDQSIDQELSNVHSDQLEMFELNDEESLAIQRRQRRLGLDSTDEDEDDEDPRSAATVVEIVTSDIDLKPPPSKGILRTKPKENVEGSRRMHFDTLALLLDAALEGELDLVKSCASKLSNVSSYNEEGITALHNAICAGHYDIVRFLVEAGANVNAEDGDGWTPLHCAASCNNLPMAKFLIERGACIYAMCTNDHETPADKCEKESEGFDGCSQFLYSVQEKLGILNGGRVYSVYDYEAVYEDELSFKIDEPLMIIRREDEKEKGWWWAKRETTGQEGYVPRNYLALYPRFTAQKAGVMKNDATMSSLEAGPSVAEETKPPMDQPKENAIQENTCTES